jgi:uncharacterized membrane protein
MGVLLALASALGYGLSDFLGGVLSRRASFVRIALLGQLGGLVVMVLAAPLTASAPPRLPDLLWGALSGLGTGIGMMFLFRGMSRGAMSVVVPVSAVGGVALPVLVATAALGERPPLPGWLGIALALPALWLVSGGAADGQRPAGAALRDGSQRRYRTAVPGSGPSRPASRCLARGRRPAQCGHHRRGAGSGLPADIDRAPAHSPGATWAGRRGRRFAGRPGTGLLPGGHQNPVPRGRGRAVLALPGGSGAPGHHRSAGATATTTGRRTRRCARRERADRNIMTSGTRARPAIRACPRGAICGAGRARGRHCAGPRVKIDSRSSL